MTRPADRLTTLQQDGAYATPWSKAERVRMLAWHWVWLLLFRPTPKRFKFWRLRLLRWFDCRITGAPFVHPTCRIWRPWDLTLEDHAALGPRTEVYNLGPVVLRARCTISQDAYLCGGTHDLTTPDLPLVVGPIEIGPDVFVGARAFFLPGVTVGARSVVAACAVVTKDVEPLAIVGGNPAKRIGTRQFNAPPGHPAHGPLPDAAEDDVRHEDETAGAA